MFGSINDLSALHRLRRASQTYPALSPGGSGQDQSQQLRRYQRDTGLAQPPRLRPGADSNRTTPVRQTTLGRRWTARSMRRIPSPPICACRCFPGRRFATSRTVIQLHALPDLRGAIPAFIFSSDGKLHDVNVLDGTHVTRHKTRKKTGGKKNDLRIGLGARAARCEGGG